MSTKLIAQPADVGIDPADIAANPGAIVDIHEDVLRDLMTAPHAIQVRAAGMGSTGGDGRGITHPRRRVCI